MPVKITTTKLTIPLEPLPEHGIVKGLVHSPAPGMHLLRSKGIHLPENSRVIGAKAVDNALELYCITAGSAAKSLDSKLQRYNTHLFHFFLDDEDTVAMRNDSYLGTVKVTCGSSSANSNYVFNVHVFTGAIMRHEENTNLL